MSPSSVASLLRPLMAFDGLMAVLVMTRDGLPVEMIGHGLRADVLAAEAATVGEAARTCFENLQMGAPKRIKIDLENHEVDLFELGPYYLAVLFSSHGNHALVADIVEGTRAELIDALGGN